MRKPQTTELELVEPAFVSVRFHGKLEADEITAVLDQIEAFVKDEPFFAFEAHMGNIDGASPEARRITADRLRQLPPWAIGVVGGGFAQRTLAKLVLTAVSILSSGDKIVNRFFDDSDSARAWLRQQLAQRRTPKK
jgi:hypothetical protein